ncbi:chromosome segregation protein SMC [Rothia sp. HMSC036D11]|uniref:chromosome segregation protein SMC n=1 Tax=Rothia sp. HMSC036D11 TaxID=1739462 RepID=UPI0008A1ADC8|nr:chromosome segregation protein SMC [Rothia sp. HMSC036D11]OFQ07867.1 chromosome segregation protein SMC [Rothia sp. HMSC036D11]
MHLTSLTLRGFKSFASSTTFEFAPGINAVVGPNGSGKSNIMDALAWVMGEQGAKTLRGGSMQDVIFAGSGTSGAENSGKSQLGRAQVVLRLDNTDGALSIPADTVEISRTMFRAGGSEYEINGSPARLSDVHDILAEAGMGREMHVLIGQGQLDKILHASAAERREIMEEAAGILKYRRRQDKTARKLEAMSANLTRLNDLAAELSNQLEPLGDQAESAATARELQARIRELHGILITRETHALNAQVQEQTRRLSDTIEQAHELDESREKIRTRRKTLDENLESTRREQTEANAHLARIRELVARVNAVIAVAAERAQAEENAPALEDYRQEVERCAQRLAEDEKNRDSAAVEYEKAQTEAQESERRVQELTSALATLENTRAKREVERDRARERRAELAEATAVARATYERACAVEETRRAEHEDLTAESARMAKTVAHSEAALQTAAAEEETHQRDLTAAASARTKAEETREKASARVLEASQTYAGAHERAATLREALGQSLDIAGNLSEVHLDQLVRVFEVLTIEKGWERAASAALAAFASAAINAPQDTHISRLISDAGKKTAKTKKPSRKTEELAEKTLDLSDVPDAVAALTVITPVTDSAENLLDKSARTALNAALYARLHGVYFVQDAPAAALALTAGAYRVYDRQGIEYTAYSVLHPAHEQSALELAAAAQAACDDAEKALEKLNRAKKKLTAAERTLTDALDAERSTAKLLGESRAARARAEAEHARILSRSESLHAEIARAAEKLHHAADEAQELQSAYQQTRDELTAHEEARITHSAEAEADGTPDNPADLEGSLAQARKTLHKAEQHHARVQAEAAQRVAEMHAAEASMERTREVYSRAERALTAAQAAREQAHRLATAARSQQRQAHALADALATEAETWKNCLDEIAHSMSKTAEQRAETYTEEQDLATAHQAALALISRAETELARLDTRRETLAERSRLLTQLPLDEILQTHPNPDENAEDYVPTETIQTRLAATERELEKLGKINPLALEEYEALSERHTYLREQIADLKKSRGDVMTVMDEVTTHIAEVFTQAFNTVNEHYERIFGILFPGGEGRLELSDPDDILNSGVDIYARPAGKKVKRLSLLSGGERSLASLALLIAIFMASPSPFYALDEVEAALDDRNLGRVLTVLQELGERSQLIVITHQKRTMQIAQTLYGVSMRNGVSTVISQNMDELRELL